MVRLFTIIWAAIRFLARASLGRQGEDVQRSRARALRNIFEDLGTAFVKLGQLLSIRRDLLPDVYVEAFQGLLDRVQPFESALARAEIERSLGLSIATAFSQFEDAPLAAASIAQVHAAVLADGREVIVKVRRPGVVPQVTRDMRLLKWAVRLLARLSSRVRQFDPLALVRELEENLHRELDFRHEARNVVRFTLAFKDSPTVYVPALVDEWYSDSVLIQLRSGGLRVDDPRIRLLGRTYAKHFVDAYVYQFFSLGVFHGDPHPGNLFFMADGRICFHDYGLVGYIDRRTRLGLANFIQALVYLDSEWLLDAYLDLGVLGGEINRRELVLGLDNILADYAALPLKEWSFAEAFFRVARLGKGRNIRLPHNLLVLMRAVFLMENVVATLDPDYVLVEGLRETAGEVARLGLPEPAGVARLRAETGMFASELPRLLAALMRASRADEDGQDERRSDVDERASKRIALAIVLAGVFVSWALLPRTTDLPLLVVLAYGIALWLVLRR
ncbi:MAG: AarF/UbiB family protein [Gammaproteobacteria bacterium]|nr:AarF/UbiB family protein [Gammaproteobacteria bacterium]